ncbi:MAG: hypothetical protein ACK5JT_07055 [Hyphomicrobiaceae bacterium]
MDFLVLCCLLSGFESRLGDSLQTDDVRAGGGVAASDSIPTRLCMWARIGALMPWPETMKKKISK